MYLMFDSVDLTQIPKNPHAVAGYVGGQWPTDSHDALRRLFPHSFVVSIATEANQIADFLDVENGDASITQLRGWMDWMFELKRDRPGVYGSRSTQDSVPGTLRGLKRQTYRKWLADPTGVPHCPNDFGACQFDWHYLNRNLDVSLCQPWFFTAENQPLYLLDQHTA
jgi:hypothetical protein